MNSCTQTRYKTLILLSFVMYLSLFLASFTIGRYSDVNAKTFLEILLYKGFGLGENSWNPLTEQIVFQIRMPRIIGASLVGASLSVSGASYQALFSNHMASPDTLGVSSGAGLGAAIAILLGLNSAMIQGMAFFVGCLSVICAVSISNAISKGQNVAVFLILTGMVISSFMSAILSIVKYIADPMDQLPAITYWLMGSFKNISISDNIIMSIVFICAFGVLFLIRWRMNLLIISEQESLSMGANITIIRIIVIIASTLLTASSISISGGIGWVGLVVPHIARLIVGNDLQKVIPLSALFGATFLLLMDNLARYIFAAEVPIGILTAIIGAPVFFAALIRNRRTVSDD